MHFDKIIVSTFFVYSVIVHSTTTENTGVIEFCNEFHNSRRLILVSTLDGKLSALNIDDGGKEIWNVPTEPGPLLSSTIHHLELSENSQLIRIIPSLSGGLYKFDGESIEPMTVNTDTLLKSYWEEVDISGGKEIRSYALDIESGDVLYECSMNECNNWTENAYVNYDIILLKRETQKVRAIEVQSRIERWNYSVGLHNITISHNGIPICDQHSRKYLDFLVKAVVPKGLLYLVKEANPDETVWEHQFSSPIVNVWILVGSHLQLINLFEPVKNYTRTEKSVHPTFYIGIHDDQLYIQESEPLHKNHLLLEKSRFLMKQYRLIHALDIENKENDVPLITDKSERNATTALAMLYGSELVKGEGYYLYCADGNLDCQSKKGPFPAISKMLKSSFTYWKEVIILSTVTFFLMQYLIPCPNLTSLNVVEITKSLCGKFRKQINTEEALKAISTESDSGIGGVFFKTECETTNFRSRYLDDFEPIHCLGKGGFGVVFQARNKMDDCHYAIKRITLPNKKEARERVMREVKALAKLEHQFIVRYFQAWQECPPVGWQEEQDKLWKNKTRDEYLSSEADGLSESSIKSSQSYINNKYNLEINNVNFKKENEEGDSFIIFKNSGNSESINLENICESNFSQNELYKKNTGLNNSRRSLNKISKVYLYIQMQLCQKHSLREWLCDNLDREPNMVLLMFDQIVQAVEYVHLQGLIHRDLKPSNIFFSPDGQIKVGDFGLVTEIIEDTDLSTEQNVKCVYDESHTANVGTELYMSPEQINGKPYTYKVDIYSLGIILFELLTPFSTQMERSCALSNLRNSKFPQDFQFKYKCEYDLLLMMLSTKPEKRPTTYGIRSRPPFNKFHISESPISKDWLFELPTKNSICNSSILRKPSAETT